MSKNPKIALVHDYLREYGGAERVLEALHELYPDAPVYVAFKDEQALGLHWSRFQTWKIKETWLSLIPGIKKLYSPLRILAATAFESLDLSEFDVVISSSNAYMAKAIRVRPDALHICYCHTPPRSLYGYMTMTEWQKNPVTHFFGTMINHYMRVIDVKVAQQVGFFVANSDETSRRIQKFYRRDSEVIYPPVDLPDSRKVKNKAGDYYLYVGRIAQSKHVDLAIQACTELDVPLKVVGEGKGVDFLKSLAGPKVEWVGAVNDQQLHEIYAGAKAVIFPAEDEDFGIVPVEAMGHGVPVIAHRSGGPMETIIEGKTGVFFDELTVASVVKALKVAEKIQFKREQIVKHSRQFSKSVFQKKMDDLVTRLTTSN